MGRQPEQCGLQGICHNQIVVEGDGSTYPCDFYCIDDKKTGNINEHILKEIIHSNIAHQFINESKEISEKCKACKFFMVCIGGCRRERDIYTNTPFESSENIYCSALYSFFDYATPYFQDIALNMH